MSRQFAMVGIALLATCAFVMLLVPTAETEQLADRYHARNRSSNFYARSAGKPEKVNSGGTVVGKKVVVRNSSAAQRTVFGR